MSLQKLSVIAIVFISLVGIARAEQQCRDYTMALQVLGSGGPIADDARASSGYLLWAHGKSVALIDVGGGVFQRFGEAQAQFPDLEFIGLTHVHTDHSTDLSALIKSSWFSGRSKDLAIAGPSGNVRFPDLEAYLQALMGPKGAYRYLSGFLTGDETYSLERKVIDVDKTVPTNVLTIDRLTVNAIGVPHGTVPSLAYRLEINGKVIVISGDQNGTLNEFVNFAKDADLLVMPFPIPNDAGIVARYLHASPDIVGELAHKAKVKQLVLSHFMARSLRNLTENVAAVEKSYKGEIVLAEDLMCIPLQ